MREADGKRPPFAIFGSLQPGPKLTMGRPYKSELARLPEAYAWALKFAIGGLEQWVRRTSHSPLVAVGSGGSFSAAHLAAHLHQTLLGVVARTMTPLEATSFSNLRSTSVFITSAEGRNPDIIGFLRQVVEREPENLLVLTARVGSPLAKRTKSVHWANAIELGVPTGKDGFIATNSLLATAILLVRTYLAVSECNETLPESFNDLIDAHGGFLAAERASAATAALSRNTLIVLHGPTSESATKDLESKFSETGLANVLLADYRSFAHGRHYWLAKHASSTGIIAFISKDDRALAERTLDLLPPDIPIVRVETPYGGAIGSLASLAAVFYIVDRAAEIRSVDPGCPRVPTFGRKIYHLKAFRPANGKRSTKLESPAILRKIASARTFIHSPEERERWRCYERTFVTSLQNTIFGGIVFDYDGTLCEPSRRTIGLRQELGATLSKLTKGQCLLGIATGRGQSAETDLRRVLAKRDWRKVLVGYYNGAVLKRLSEDAWPAKSEENTDLDRIVQILERDGWWKTHASATVKHGQLTVVMADRWSEALWQWVQELTFGTGLRAVRSRHSFDVLSPAVSKMKLVAWIESECLKSQLNASVLRIGDLGRPPGNDAELLASPFGLSVDQVSADPTTCWNLAPAGLRGVPVTEIYVGGLTFRQDGLSITLDNSSTRAVP